MEYSQYLKSEDWKHKRKKVYHKARYHCQACKAENTELHAHHIKYRDLGNESIGKDFLCLCKTCHFKLHDWIKSGIMPTWNDYRLTRRKATKKAYRKMIKAALNTKSHKHSTNTS